MVFVGNGNEFPVMPIPHGETRIGLSEELLDNLYRPPKKRGNFPREWEQWAGRPSGKRHNPINGKRDSKIELKFSVCRYVPGKSYTPGIESVKQLTIMKYRVTFQKTGTLDKVRFEVS